jgi:hypothetical protein
MDIIYREFVQYRETLKLYHFQCKTFPEHKASDETLKTFDELFDTFFEVYSGHIKSRLNFNIPLPLNIVIKSNVSKSEMLVNNNTLILLLNKLSKFKILSSDLLNIIDEMLQLLHKFNYLLSFE